MNHNAGTVPFNYGDLFAITSPGPVFWFQDKLTGAIRGVKLVSAEGTHRLLIGDEEIHIKRSGAGENTARPGQRTPLPGSIQSPLAPRPNPAPFSNPGGGSASNSA